MSGHGKGERRKHVDRRGTGMDRRTTPGGTTPQERRTAERRGHERRSAGQRLEVILDITRQLMAVTDLDALLHTMAEETANLLGADRATIYVIDRERNELWSRVALGAGEIRFPIGRGIAGTVAQTGETINIPDAYKDSRFNPEPDRLSGYRTTSLLTFPMKGNEGRVIGVFQVVNKKSGPFTADDESTLASLGASAAVAVENAQLVAEQKRLWQSLIETLATTVDARDQQTAGHSKRVTRYAAIIGKSMGWMGKDLEKLEAAALLHDYGKIAVRDQFLQKPGKLDEAELEYMKTHAEKTSEFLARIVFPLDMREVPMIASQHHERMDGKGYPKGLNADRIHIGARIVAAADIFDALTAPRYYKPAYALDKTMEMMNAMAGPHLDPRVMEAVRRALPELSKAMEELKPTWPKETDEGMGTIAEAALSERDAAEAGTKR